jgi:hypothetical protein
MEREPDKVFDDTSILFENEFKNTTFGSIKIR